MICLSFRAFYHRTAGNSSPRHRDKWQPGSGSRMKLSCLNLSLERQPELLRCFHSAPGRDSTRKVRAEETGGCLGAEGKGQSSCPQEDSTEGPLWPPRPATCLWIHGDPRALPQSWHTFLAGSWSSSFMLHRADPHGQGDNTSMCNPGKPGSIVMAATGGPENRSEGSQRLWKVMPGCQDRERRMP